MHSVGRYAVTMYFYVLNTSKMLRGTALPVPKFRLAPLSKDLTEVKGYQNLQTFFPTLKKLFNLKKWKSTSGEIWMDQMWRILSIDCSGTAGPCLINVFPNKDLSDSNVESVEVRKAFMKATHLLDPIQWIKGEYSLSDKSKLYSKTLEKLNDPGNKAYVETIAAYSLGRLNEEDISPHFNSFYGAFCATAGIYRYNLTDDYQSYKYERWFWKGFNKNLFKFHVINEKYPDEPVPEDVLNEIMEQLDENNNISDSVSNDGKSIVLSLDDIKDDSDKYSLKSADSMNDIEVAESNLSDSDESDSNISYTDDYAIYIDIPSYPVMLILTEQNEGTMDALFESIEIVASSPGTTEWEGKWSAWLFQIVSALSCIQTLLGFTHNDLHTNNIVWSTTTVEYIYYKNNAGFIFKVPTYGKLFRIIDFGRAIFTLNGQMFISDDFKKDNDAEGQYEFVPLVKKVKKEIPPNPSFDLCRLAVSMIHGIFPKKPAEKVGGDILSKEEGITVFETVSPLYNMIWKWMIDDKGKNIFINADGTERFPSFDLYKHIAEYVHLAVPSQQIMNPVFDSFQIPQSELPAGVKVYSLFC
jgi:hypothetical protein